MAGRKLDLGDTFAEVVNASSATVDVAVEETDVPLVQAGDYAALKLEGFPTEKFKGSVARVSLRVSTTQGDKRVFVYARVEIPNTNGTIRPGMQGTSKVTIG